VYIEGEGQVSNFRFGVFGFAMEVCICASEEGDDDFQYTWNIWHCNEIANMFVV